ncbi:MAG: hypothetical protein WBK88_01785 [Methanothrix sp.]
MEQKSFGFVGLMSAALIVLLAGIAAAATFSPALVVDTYMDASEEDETFAEAETLWASSDGGEPVRIAFLVYSEMVKLAMEIESGELRAYVTEVERPGAVTLRFYDMAVLETETWRDMPRYDDEPLATLNIQETGWATWDATALLKKAADECAEGCPFTVVLVAEGDASIGFGSMEGSSDKKAVIEYIA